MSNPIEVLMSALEWKPIQIEHSPGPGDVYATHEGVLVLGEFQFQCYQLNDGRRVLAYDDVARFFGGMES